MKIVCITTYVIKEYNWHKAQFMHGVLVALIIFVFIIVSAPGCRISQSRIFMLTTLLYPIVIIKL
jgi:uncharacterized MnhB-related membrane protein